MPGQKISSMTLVNDVQADDRFPVARNGSTYSVRGRAFATKNQLDSLSAAVTQNFTNNTLTNTLTSGLELLSAISIFKPSNSFHGQVLTYNSSTLTWVASGLPAQLPRSASPFQILTYSPDTFSWVASAAPLGADDSKTDNTPIGAVMLFAATTAPVGWFECAGQWLNKTAYPDLWETIGYTFGSKFDGQQFRLPDLRGEFIRGWDHERGVDLNREFGSFQKGSVAGDLAAVVINGPMLSAKNILGLDTDYQNLYPDVLLPHLSADTSFHLITEFETLSGESPSLSAITGVSRPRNIALMACIKYSPIKGLTPVGLSAQNILNAVNSLSGFSMGYNQVWQDYTPNRLPAVTYTNTTGRPIMVHVYTYQENVLPTGTFSALISSTAGSCILNSGPAWIYPTGSTNNILFIVPPYNTYKVTVPGNVITNWSELR